MIYRNRSELVSCLKDLLSSPKKAERLGAAARQVARGHTWEKVAERVSGAYDTIAEESMR
jgi:glycosyltransferase involved in cell wall biosynthesis